MEPINPAPHVTTLERVQQQEGYQAVQPTRRPPYADADLDLARRPGVPRMSKEPRPWPNTRFPPERQPGESTAPMHGRSNKTMTPVFGTTLPLRGLSGVVRKFASRYPDHYPSYWLLKMLGDRVDVWSVRVRRALPVVLPFAALGYLGRRALR